VKTPARDLSIRKKLAWMGMLSSGTALLTASAAFVAYDLYSFRERLVERLDVMAQVIAYHSTPAILFRDEAVAAAGLQALDARPQIVGAVIYDEAGGVLGLYARPGAAFRPPAPPAAGSTWHRFESDGLVLVRPILSEGAPVGSVAIRSDLSEVRRRLARFGLIAFLVAIPSFGVALLISRRQQASIAKPVQALAGVARAVSEDGNYAVRAEVYGRDELGSLTETFNAMLGHIQTRDREVQEAREDLERRVEERTRELTTVNREMEAFT
jgi:methyl-accepting chemotaxis protein